MGLRQAWIQTSLRIRAVWSESYRLPTLLQVKTLIANSMDPDQTARMRRLDLIHAGRKRTMLVLSWRGSYVFYMNMNVDWSIWKYFYCK
jgi:hypothetical protein